MKATRLCISLCLLAALTACANVAPSQRAILSKPQMQFDFDKGTASLAEHTYASKEGTAGGRAVGGGGCGCT